MTSPRTNFTWIWLWILKHVHGEDSSTFLNCYFGKLCVFSIRKYSRIYECSVSSYVVLQPHQGLPCFKTNIDTWNSSLFQHIALLSNSIQNSTLKLPRQHRFSGRILHRLRSKISSKNRRRQDDSTFTSKSASNSTAASYWKSDLYWMSTNESF